MIEKASRTKGPSATRLPVRRLRVRGPSMAPRVRGNDIVLVNFYRKPRPGSIVLVRWPGLLCVKRAVRPDGDGWLVLGDNQLASTDSRQLGPAEVLGVISWRLWPRFGRIR